MKPSAVPEISPRLHRWFVWYSRRYLKRHFHAVRLLQSHPPPAETAQSRVYFLNHASWWDPLVALFLAARFYPDNLPFAPIDERALERYGLLKRLGFFPVERGTARGARQFLRSAREILKVPGHALWLTPQGRFADVRERPVRFEAGLVHLPDVPMIPIAIEYTWWFERSPEVLIAFGNPVDPSHCEQALAAAQDALATAGIARDPDAFVTLLSGKTGVGGFYDTWRRFRARFRGERFTPDHHQPDPP